VSLKQHSSDYFPITTGTCLLLPLLFTHISTVKANSHLLCHAHAVSLRVKTVFFPFDLHSVAMFDSHKPCRAHAAPLLCCNHAVLKATSQDHGTVRHGICELTWATERWPVSDLPMFVFIQLLHGHSQRSLTRKLLPVGMCLIVLMMKEPADYTEYELTFKLTPVFLLWLCYISIVYYSFLARHPHCVLIIHKQREKKRCRLTV
jgi:hypothetical protein